MIKINLLPKDARKRVGLGQQIFIIVVVLILNFTGIGMYWNYLDGVIEQKRLEIQQTQQALQELQKIIDEINKFEEQRKALEQKLAIIATLQKEQQLPVHLLDEVYLTLEDDMWLNNFTQSGMNVTIQGTALSNPVVSDYMRNLDKSEFFDKIELGASRLGKVGTTPVRQFDLKMVVTPPQNVEGTQEASQ